MPTIFIGGYYGAGNLGDEAILDSMLRDLRSLRSDLSFSVTSWDPAQTSKQYNVNAVHWKDINGILASGQQADLILLGGGGLFQDYWGMEPETYLRRGCRDITAYGSLPLLAKLLDIPCMIYAMGLGPLQSTMALEHTRLAFERCQAASLRDNESLELLRRTGFQFGKAGGPSIEVLADPVFSLVESEEDDNNVAEFLRQRQIDDQTELVGVVLRFWDRAGSLHDWLPPIAEGINRYLGENTRAQVVLIPFQVNEANPYTDDAAVLKQLYQFMAESWRVHIIEESITPRFAQALIKKCSVVLGMRLHALILGINVSTPIVALPYDPKVSALMKQAGLEAFCCDSISPNPEELAAKLKIARDNRKELQARMRTLGGEWATLAKKNATLAVSLLRDSRRARLNFPQQFALEQLALLEKTDHELEVQLAENHALQSRLSELEILAGKLAEIQTSNFWKLAKLYYRIMDESPVRHVYKFMVAWKQEGLGRALQKAAEKIKTRATSRKSIPVFIDEEDLDSSRILQNAIKTLNSRSLKGIFVVTSAFVFDELYNQRVINLSKFLARENWGVIYVAWRWTREEKMPGAGQEVYKNVFQIPVDVFLQNLEDMAGITHAIKYFVVEFPHPEFFSAALKLRRYDFKAIYEIIDDWEEFNKVGQAIWFTKNIEKALVLNANFLTAVSQPLVDKFSGVRRDIHLIPNGYDPALLGTRHRNIAKRKFKEDEMHLGYFGHLTESWFDWDFLFGALDLAEKKNIKLKLHIIGYGEPNQQERLEKYQDRVKLYGKIKPSDLHHYAREWDAALICFKSGRLSEAVDPIKVYEYAYFGLPVIVKGINHLKDYPSVYVVSDEEQFIGTLGALRNNAQMRRHEFVPSPGSVEQMLAKSTWKRRFSHLLNILESEGWMSL
ncbi:MAG: polysaccharide pyruvyl transferase family protein [Chloroflexi bacterium]|nr:polysaccharide pyruvyl transferase family protein [Chloroflexota bacterium]